MDGYDLLAVVVSCYPTCVNIELTNVTIYP